MINLDPAGMLGVGDDQGSLVLYNLDEVLKRKADDDEQENVWEASLVCYNSFPCFHNQN